MADKFEFKKLQHIDLICEPRLDIKKKPSLLEYKQVILQLSNALNSMSQQNLTLIQQIKTTDQLKQQLKTKLQKQIQKCKQLQNYKISNQEQSRKNNIEIEQYHQKLIQNQQKIKVLESKNQQLQTHVMELLQNKDKLQRINEVNLEKIRVLQQNLDMLIEQGRNIKLQINQANRQKEWQLKEMKQFHDQIKRKFQVLQIQTAENQSYSKDLRFEHKLNDLKQKRSFSTQKKVRRNVGHLSNSNNIQKKTMRSKNYRLDNPICSSVKPFQASLNNPQITEQLKNLKKQIAQQYTLINLKTQTYSKQRVSKTLQELKRKMGKVIQIVQHSQSQSAIEY